MNNQNVVLDFTINKSLEALTARQELAIMPATLAKELLKMYAGRLIGASAEKIIEEHRTVLRGAQINKNLDEAIQMSISWLQERDLIENISKGNWDAYTCSSEEPIEEVVIKPAIAL